MNLIFFILIPGNGQSKQLVKEASSIKENQESLFNILAPNEILKYYKYTSI